MQIPWQSLSEDALDGVLEEYATREGTEYGWREYSLEEKVGHLRRQLERGEALIDYDPDTGTIHLVPVNS
ncbi:MAG: YheU family protein [Pseudohongiellaceae bacterium]